MIQFPDTENRREFYEILDAEFPPPEHRPSVKNEQADTNVIAWVDYPILFGKSKIDYIRVFKHADAVEGRLRLAKSCEDDIKDKCELVEESDSLEESSKLGDDFIISVEYFFLALRSTWDIMAKLLCWAYGLDLEERNINIYVVRDKLQSADVDFGDQLDGFLNSRRIEEFNKVRNRLGHHLMPKLDVLEIEDQTKVCLKLDQTMLPITLPERVTKPLLLTEDMIDTSFGALTAIYDRPSFPENVMDADEDYLPRPLD